MYCYADADTSYKIDCLRNCSTDCLEDQSTDPVCASDLGTYDGSCDMKVRCPQLSTLNAVLRTWCTGINDVLRAGYINLENEHIRSLFMENTIL